MKRILYLALGTVLVAGCSAKPNNEPAAQPKPAPVVYFKVDPETAATVSGEIHFKGKKPAPKPIDM